MSALCKPNIKPLNPNFGCGPTTKPISWNINNINTQALGRSHRSILGKQRIRHLIQTTRKVLEIPSNYKIAIVAGSATGAVECILWNALGPTAVDVMWTDIFGKLWVHDVVQELKLPNKIYDAPFGVMPTVIHSPDHDLILTINGTTSGVLINDYSWINDNRNGLVIADATSAAGAVTLPWNKLDAVGFSWQKAFGSEGAHGMVVLSPRAVERINQNTPIWPMPRLFRIKKDGVLNETLFIDEPINTPSLLCIEDCILSLEWYESLGGIKQLEKITLKNFSVISDWVNQSSWATWAVSNENYRSPISPCIFIKTLQGKPEQEQRDFLYAMANVLSNNQAAFDIVNHKLSAPSLRIWCGPNVDSTNLMALLPWLDYAFEVTQNALMA